MVITKRSLDGNSTYLLYQRLHTARETKGRLVVKYRYLAGEKTLERDGKEIMAVASFVLAVVGTVIALCAASRWDFVNMFRYFERKRDNRQGWEWCQLIEHHSHSHANDMHYTVDTRMYPHLRPDPHHEFYNKPVKVPLPVSKSFIANGAARRTLVKPVITYEELTGYRVEIADGGGVSYESVLR